ncbi:MAG: molybdenum ABC transporter ATP-binding protein [Yoonia sp.]|nr:molybdenum ABC transporter ATP-binding protein [Yoonia sp.]
MIRVNVQKKLGDFTLDVAFDAPRGVTAIFGRSGSGKTTLINAIAGLMMPDSGRISLSDRVLFDQTRSLPPRSRKLGLVFQDARLFPHLTVAKNLTFGGRHDHDRIVDLLGLGRILVRKPADLSGGEKQRVALGRALMSDPDMLLLDEPLAALDTPRKAEILPYLEQLRDDFGMPMIYVSHAMSEVARLANYLVVLDAGKVVRAGPLAEVLSHPASVPMLGVRDAGAVIAVTVAGYDADDHLTRLTFDGGQMSLPGHVGRVGQGLRVRIPAQDVILASQIPAQISARNILPVTVTAIEDGRGPGVVIGLMAGETPLLARITKASLRDMKLSVGADIFAIIKATAVAPEDAGR